MSIIARLEVIPTREGNMSEAVANAVGALDGFDVSYETTPTDTVIEADDVSEVFAAAEAAHRAVGDERVITSLEVDEHRTRRQDRHERVASVEQKLGHPAKRERPESKAGGGQGVEPGAEARQRGERGAEPRQRGERGGEPRQRAESGTEPRQRGEPEAELRRYHGPVRTQSEQRRDQGGQRRETRPTETRTTGTGSTESGRTTPRYLRSRRPISR